MTQILKGSIVCGKSGKPLEVVAIDEGKVVVKSGNELLRVNRSAILQVLLTPPEAITPLTVGDTVYYCGDRYWEQFKGMPLVLFELREGLWICEKPDGYRTTNLPAKELSRLPVDQPKVTASRNPQKGQWLKDWESEQRRK
jgi:hypothetical protein